jgi:hypothetical protein
VEKFVRHLCRLVLRHQMPVWNYFVNSFYSVPAVSCAAVGAAVDVFLALLFLPWIPFNG